MADIVLLRPLWVLALPVVVALAVLAHRHASRPGNWDDQIEPHLMSALARMGRVERGRTGSGAMLPFAVAGLIALALTGPALQRDTARTFRNLDGVVFAVDVSGSTTRDPAWVSAVTLLRGALSGLGGKPAALVVYAGDSYLAAPLTTDHLQLGQTVSLLDETTVPDRGNRPELALALAARLLEEAAVLDGQVVLVTDGEGLGPESLEQAARIAAKGASLSILRLDTTVSGNAAPMAELETVARVGGGSVHSTTDIASFVAAVSDTQPELLAQRDLRLLFYEDYGRYLLSLALLPMLMLFRRDAA
ncbi:VWA domain-containing protein [Sulfitobacter sp. D35]|uniref:VWA domain-containing protein n=1 Tax=Sulfitobacter sp. D35 TaxID=3083252 RepID=UPI00296EC945|nr:VWA domain-containing protein [Sulfitobacter sp. D35]MDW4498645.1 VWA domain-containing protein [Sulfitobacter sp. D35]